MINTVVFIMKKFILFSLFTILLALGLSQKQLVSWHELLTSYHSANKIFQKAEQLTNQAGDDEILLEKADDIYAKALNSYEQIAPLAEKTGYDSLLFFTKLQSAFISYYLSKPIPAKLDYLQAINLKSHLPAIEDSFLFLPLVYTGGIYYSENKFDSAMYYYKAAEKIKDNYENILEESQRLYNRLGAMYYETGNYRQARNYFEKAIAILHTGKNMDEGLLANYQVNIASILVKLEEFQEARELYKKVLLSGIYNNEVNHNLAIINLKEEKFKEALQYLNKVDYPNSKKNIDLLYNKGMAWSGLNNKDSADKYLSKAIDENIKWHGKSKSIAYGLILKYKADLANKEFDYKTALRYYQQAINQFDNSFSQTDSTKNPEEFSGVFSYINLFNTLAAKADVFEKLYGKEKKINRLENALSAYQATFKLADYVEKTYDTDEARLFLGKIKYTVHSRPIDIGIHLYELTKEKKYLETVWSFDQRNKASLLALNLQEAEWKNKLTTNNKSLQKEVSLKNTITRLLLRTQNNTDSILLSSLYSQIRDNEIELGKIQDKINASPEMKKINLAKEVPGIKQLQKEIDGTTAIVSYHLSDTKILTFCITAKSIDYVQTALTPELSVNIAQFRNALQNTLPGQQYNGASASKELFKKLMSPIINHLSGLQNLIIIPDDELYYLPFEALQDENSSYLLEHFAIQYLYSASLFQKNNTHINYSGILGFAPFASTGIADSNGVEFKRLTYSKEEIEQPNGKLFIDSAATKKNFLTYANQYQVLHLATHAKVDNNNANRSYITFYPGKDDFLLYAPEIYNLDLDSTQLVILSACETGTGQLVKGEGLMSLSRAFAYAGCSNIIASLWKAEDKTTSFITRQLHVYLSNGYTKARALQKAKIDLLNNKEISPALKSPNYWGHLVFIGDYETGTKSNYLTWLIMAVCLLIAGSIFFFQRKTAVRKTQL